MKNILPPLFKFNLCLIFGFAMVLLIINSCKKAEDVDPFSSSKKISVNELRLLYHSKIGATDQSNASRSATNGNIDWEHPSSLKKLNGSYILSVPILRNKTDLNNGAQRRLVANRDSNNKLDMAIMVVIPDKAYLAAKKGRLSMKDFTGYMIFFEVNNTFRKGHILNDGKITGEISLEQYHGNEINSRDKLASLKNGQFSQEFLLQSQSGATYRPKTFEYLVTECEWRQAGYYVDNDGVLNIIAVKYCKTTYVPDPVAPFQIDPFPDGDGDGGGIWEPYDCANVLNGIAYINYECQTCMGGTTGITQCPLELNTDALKARFPCADKLIAQPILTSAVMSKFVEPFLTPQRPTITYLTDNTLAWGNTTTWGTFMLGNNNPVNSGAGLSSIVTFNEKMLQNSSQLLIAATVVHETLHAYINYNIAMANNNYNNSDGNNWMVGLDNFYLMGNLPTNYSNHTMMLKDYFEKSMAVLQAWNAKQGFIYETKDMASAMLYGLDTYDTGTPQSQINNINAVFESVKTKYNITSSDLTTFNRANLITTTNRLPTTGCN